MKTSKLWITTETVELKNKVDTLRELSQSFPVLKHAYVESKIKYETLLRRFKISQNDNLIKKARNKNKKMWLIND